MVGVESSDDAALPRASSRVATSACLALAAAGVLAVLELAWAQRVATEPLNLVRGWLVAFSLLAPVAVAVGLVVGAGLPLLHVPVARAWSSVRGGTEGLVGLPIVALAVAVTLALIAHLALRLLSVELPPATFACTLSLAAVLLSRTLVGAGLRFAGSAGRSLGLAHLGRAGLLLSSLGLLVAPIAYGVASGTPNGEGGVFQVFGVFARQELDLRSSAVLLGLFACAYAGPIAWGIRPPVALFVTALSLGAISATATRLLDDLPLGLAIERGAALSRTSLGVLRRATDGDGDGESRYFGGRDCDDGRTDVFPGAFDVPDNGVDEDCSGQDAAAPAPPPAPKPRPLTSREWIEKRLPDDLSVILITVDTLRYDLGYTGYERPISPHLDRLAERSVVFDRAYALASYTGKSLGPMLIGRYPSETHRGWWHFNKFGEEDTFVQERLQAAGIRTLSVQGHWYFTPEYGLGRGFDVLDLSAKPRRQKVEGDRTVNSHLLTDAAIAQLSQPQNVSERFFLWVHYLDPHADYVPHPEFSFGRRGRDLYDGEVAYTDHHIGRLLDFVAGSDLADRTAIIVTSDHGEAFGEHGMWRHGFELWEALVRVPLIVHVPGVEPRHHPVRRGAIDLAPTLLELFGLPLPEGDDRLSGDSLLEDVFMPPEHAVEERPVFIDMSAGPYNEERRALIDAGLKVIVGRGRFLNLYDLARDPNEDHDRLGDAALVARMKESYERFTAALRPVHVKPR